MAAIASHDYRHSHSFRQEKLVSCRPIVSGLEVNFQVPWTCIEFAASFLPQLIGIFSEQVAKRMQPANGLHEQATQKNRELRTMAGRAARLMRIRVEAGEDETAVIEDIALQFQYTPEGIRVLTDWHNRMLKLRAEGIRDYRLVRWARNGLSNQAIAERLGFSESYTAKLVRKAINRVQGAANDN